MRLAKLIAILCASGTALVYDSKMSPDGPNDSSLWIAAAAGFAATIWVKYVFPFMGKSWTRDILLILLAFPAVGGLSGLFASLGFPSAAIAGMIFSVQMPWMFPLEIIPIYAIGICAAFILPTLNR